MQTVSCSPGVPETTHIFPSFSSTFCPCHSLTESIKKVHLVFNASPETKSSLEVTSRISIAYAKFLEVNL